MTIIVKPDEDPSTKAKRFVIGDRRMITGVLLPPQAKYVTGGFALTPQEVGFDKYLYQMAISLDKEAKVLATYVEESLSGGGKLKFFSAIAAELAAESEVAKEKEFPFIAVGE